SRRAGAGRAHRRFARVDGPGGIGRRPPSGLAGRGTRRSTGGNRAGGGSRRRRDGRDRRCPVLPVLGDTRADDRVGGACAPPWPIAPHSPRRDGGGRGVLHGAVRLHARRVPGTGGLARGRRLVRALRSPLRSRGAEVNRSEEHTSELQSRFDLVCRLLLEKKNIHVALLIVTSFVPILYVNYRSTQLIVV